MSTEEYVLEQDETLGSRVEETGDHSFSAFGVARCLQKTGPASCVFWIGSSQPGADQRVRHKGRTSTLLWKNLHELCPEKLCHSGAWVFCTRK